MLAAAHEGGLCLLEFLDRKALSRERRELESRFGDLEQAAGAEYVETADEQMREYFAGSRRDFDVPLALLGTAFEVSVWKLLQAIPHGRTRSYGEIADELRNPSARAVGLANGRNKIAVIVPCHRVIGANGSLTGYGGGLWRKKWLLDFERGEPELGL
jgi:AraC family transcriptional regulator of adaptative response/methylated-DNA-[protein]-cysteine methyltransferase